MKYTYVRDAKQCRCLSISGLDITVCEHSRAGGGCGTRGGFLGLLCPPPSVVRPRFAALVPPSNTTDFLAPLPQLPQDRRRMKLEFLHPCAGPHGHNQHAVIPHDDGRGDLRDLRADELSPLRNHTCLVESSLEPRVTQVLRDRVANRFGLGARLVRFSTSQGSRAPSSNAVGPAVPQVPRTPAAPQ